ncbi:hypothetical protein Tco_0293245 [Tanacetum coccineum]
MCSQGCYQRILHIHTVILRPNVCLVSLKLIVDRRTKSHRVCPGIEVELSPTSYLDAGVVRHNRLRGGSSVTGISSLRSTGGMNNESGNGGSGDDGRGGCGGDGRGDGGNATSTGGGNGDEALNLPMAALKPGGACTLLGLPYG